MIRLEWTDPPVADLENIQDYIARDSPEYAEALIDRLIMSVEPTTAFSIARSGRRNSAVLLDSLFEHPAESSER
jgi:plasmid stabilization system protein ParE